MLFGISVLWEILSVTASHSWNTTTLLNLVTGPKFENFSDKPEQLNNRVDATGKSRERLARSSSWNFSTWCNFSHGWKQNVSRLTWYRHWMLSHNGKELSKIHNNNLVWCIQRVEGKKRCSYSAGIQNTWCDFPKPVRCTTTTLQTDLKQRGSYCFDKGESDRQIIPLSFTESLRLICVCLGSYCQQRDRGICILLILFL